MRKPSIKKNYLYNLVYQVLILLTPLVTSPYISRVLGADNIGIYSFTGANAGYFVLLGVFGLSTYSQFECARRRDNPEEFSRFCVESLAARFLMMGISISIYLVCFLGWNKSYRIYYLVAGISLLANMFDFTWICEGLEDYFVITTKNLFVKLTSVVAVFLFVKSEDDLIWYFIIIMLPSLLGNLAIWPYAKRFLKLPDYRGLKIWPHIKASIVYFLPSMASTIISSADKLMIGWITGDMVQNGYYEQALKIETMIFMVFATLYTTMRARMAYLHQNGAEEEVHRYEELTLSVILFMAIPICVGLIQIADAFVPLFFGPGYDGVVILLKIMAGWIFIKSFSNCILEQAVIAKGEMLKASGIIWTGAITNIILNAVLIMQFGAAGAALASMATEVVILVRTMKYADRTVLRNLLPDAAKELIAVALMYGVTSFTKVYFASNMTRLLTTIAAGAAVYLGVSACLKNRNVGEVFSLIQSIVRKKKHV